MKLTRNICLLGLALAAFGGTAGAVTDTTAAPAANNSTNRAASGAADATAIAPAGNQHWGHGRRGGPMVGMLLRAARRLDLTPDQQSTIRAILHDARPPHAAEAEGLPDPAVLGNPGDPNYPAALQAARAWGETRFQKEVELQSQIYNVLTPAQKAKLPEVLAAMKAQAQQHRARWLQQHPGTELPN